MSKENGNKQRSVLKCKANDSYVDESDASQGEPEDKMNFTPSPQRQSTPIPGSSGVGSAPFVRNDMEYSSSSDENTAPSAESLLSMIGLSEKSIKSLQLRNLNYRQIKHLVKSVSYMDRIFKESDENAPNREELIKRLVQMIIEDSSDSERNTQE